MWKSLENLNICMNSYFKFVRFFSYQILFGINRGALNNYAYFCAYYAYATFEF